MNGELLLVGGEANPPVIPAPFDLGEDITVRTHGRRLSTPAPLLPLPQSRHPLPFSKAHLGVRAPAELFSIENLWF